ncbi:MAG: hypothetical protein ACSLFD_12500 [Solirubrobacterales bacterium]
MKRRVFIALVLAIGLAGYIATPPTAGAAGFSVKSCQSVSGPATGPAPINVSTAGFTADTGCRLGSGGQIGHRLLPVNQGSGQTSRRDQWAGLQWQIPAGVSLTRAGLELGGTSENGTGSGFSAGAEPWMFRTFGLGLAGNHLLAARFSVPNNSYWFNASDAPGLYGWYWGNESGGLGTPAQWNEGRSFSFAQATGLFSETLMPGWATSQIGATGAAPAFTDEMPRGPYSAFRVELRCAEATCKSDGFTFIQVQQVNFLMDDPSPPTGVTARPEGGEPGSPGSRMVAGEWLSGGQVPVSWSATDAGTGISGARLVVNPGQTGSLSEVSCPGGRPGQVRNSFKPCPASGSGTISLDLGTVPQGPSTVTVCAEDGVAQATCSSGIPVRRDSIPPVIDAPGMKLAQGGGQGFSLSLANPDEAGIASGAASPQSSLTFTVEKQVGSGFEPVVPVRTEDVSGRGAAPVISVPGISLEGDGVYRVCARMQDAAGNSPSGLACTNLTVDDALPDTTIVSGPPTLTGDPVAGFVFTSDRPSEAGYECRVDTGGWAACPRPSPGDPYEVLVAGDGSEDGEHVFEVRAWLPPGTSGGDRRVDPTPASWRWTLDSSPPDTEIVSGPPPVATEDVTFTFRSNEPGTFECQIDGDAWTACTTPRSYVDLAPGDHAFRVRAIDLVGLSDPTPAERSFAVVPAPPVIEVVEKPVEVEVPSRKYCALTGFTIRPDAQGLKATITASRYSRFVRIQFFPDTPAVRRILSRGTYRELPMHTATGPIVTLKRKAVRNQRTAYSFPKVNLRTYPEWYRYQRRSLIAVPRVANEWNRCVVRYRQSLRRVVTDIPLWKKRWGIEGRYRLKRRP